MVEQEATEKDPNSTFPALKTSWNILVNGKLVVQPNAPTNFLIPILRRLSKYIQGDKEKVFIIMYCTLFAILFPGSLKLTDRLRLVPLTALPFLAIPGILSLNDTITLVDVMGERRPILLAVWKNQEAFMKTLQEFFNGNEKISAIIETDQYRIQDAKYSVYQPGSRMVSAGATLFMAAVFPTLQMNCPWCNAQMPVSPGWNLQAFLDWQAFIPTLEQHFTYHPYPSAADEANWQSCQFQGPQAHADSLQKFASPAKNPHASPANDAQKEDSSANMSQSKTTNLTPPRRALRRHSPRTPAFLLSIFLPAHTCEAMGHNTLAFSPPHTGNGPTSCSLSQSPPTVIRLPNLRICSRRGILRPMVLRNNSIPQINVLIVARILASATDGFFIPVVSRLALDDEVSSDWLDEPIFGDDPSLADPPKLLSTVSL
ncbi:hypothetical protein R3P38DRAFT_3170672 [Favolaschia claudopus]|uniref:Ubiquitin-like domain-containing protein n=1 Tax=Favolaschia claudopus TaxID=2862362 RepID=A0AAW0DWQ8_9AGAR